MAIRVTLRRTTLSRTRWERNESLPACIPCSYWDSTSLIHSQRLQTETARVTAFLVPRPKSSLELAPFCVYCVCVPARTCLCNVLTRQVWHYLSLARFEGTEDTSLEEKLTCSHSFFDGPWPNCVILITRVKRILKQKLTDVNDINWIR